MNEEKDFVIDLKSIKVSDRGSRDVHETFSARKPEPQIEPEKPKSNPPRHRKLKEFEPVKNRTFTYVIGIIILATVIGIGGYFLFKSLDNYYQGSWKSEISSTDKEAGIQKISYDISDSAILQETNSESNGIKSDIKIKYDTELVEKRSAGAYFKIKDIKIDSFDITVDPSLCNNQQKACDLIKDNYKKNFQEFLDKQKTDLVNTNLRISPKEQKIRVIFSNRDEVELSR